MPKDKDCRGFITAFGTSLPRHRFAQHTLAQFMKRHMALDRKALRWVELLVKQSQIDYRHSVLPDYGASPEDFSFYPRNASLEPFPTVSARMACYRENALPLAAEAAAECLRGAGVPAAGVTHLVTVSCTGMYAPGLDTDLVRVMGMNGTVERTCIGFMGCYAAFNALKVASSIVASDAEARVLVVCVELCSLHFLKDGVENSHLLTNMLFGDGASAVLVERQKPVRRPSLGLLAFATDLFPEGREEMTWEISDFGFEMKLTGAVPGLLARGVKRVFRRLMETAQGGEVAHYAFHPGGPRVLQVLEEVCGITPHENRWAREVLRGCGNMSSATFFFILQRIVAEGGVKEGELLLSAAFGPGLTCESALMRVTV